MAIAVVDMASVKNDFASSPFSGVHCGDMGCDAPNVCCIRPSGAIFSQSCEVKSTCSGSAGAASCDGPEDCSASTNLCCMNVAFARVGNGAVPKTGAASCVDSCPASVTLSADSITFASKLCHTNSDCTGYAGQVLGGDVNFDGCCYRTEIDFRFCAPKDASYRNAGSYFCLDN